MTPPVLLALADEELEPLLFEELLELPLLLDPLEVLDPEEPDALELDEPLFVLVEPLDEELLEPEVDLVAVEP